MEKDELTLSDVHIDENCPARILVDCSSYTLCQTRFIINETHNKDQCETVDPGDKDLNISTNRSVPDEDGDVLVIRKKKRIETIVYINHHCETRLNDVGMQVWQGCLYLCDYLITNKNEINNKIVLELGAGVGLSSIVAARYAKKVICTDVGDDVLALCEKNAEMNRLEYCCNDGSPKQTVIDIRELDWTKYSEGSTNVEDIEKFTEADVIIAADVVYDDTLTSALLKTIDHIMQSGKNTQTVLSIERRLNFTMSDLEVCCPAYDYFKKCVTGMSKLYDIRQVDAENLPQHVRYTRNKYLELWQITKRTQCHNGII